MTNPSKKALDHLAVPQALNHFLHAAMVLEVKPKTDMFKVQNIEGVPEHVFFTDFLGSRDEKVHNPITGSWFRIERGPPSTPPKYEYDEVGVVFEGTITLEDEAGAKATLAAGQTFVIHRGSTIAFSSSDYGIAFKCGSRLMART
ncbi:uncharacterized protein A1O9_04488 [Exophiala aquamarina CBS 119918]|uniref:(S)-ureidoglycine aminohydrolase cupin domain-containing protein n=1 Tax=Exophiala aquamarina CBS 119918 TaxID=1182545 RepID=A0A072PIR8_9EURO|nr:uncharacterized protein A1O9_04488 [Exophiala aquamarina CBS 119918]KEF59642.1 hypothetical protein A1O9_04488 [Exophiala aquamarina CBS 119918]